MQFDLEYIESLWVLERLPCESLPDVAVCALQNGIDNLPIRILAGLSSSESDEACDLFVQALSELGRGQLSKNGALRIFARGIASQIIDREIEPYVGAKQIWEASLQISNDDFHEVDPFIYAASEYVGRPEDREFFDKSIREEALRLVSS